MAQLIDADKLIMHLADYALSESGKPEYSTIQQCIKAVEEQPTIDPVKHGRWIRMEKVFPNLPNNSDYRFKCSACGWSDQHNDKMVVPYCWHCGALMDEVKE